jgi:hypothetical protein
MQTDIVFRTKFSTDLNKNHDIHVLTCYLCNYTVKNVCDISNIVPWLFLCAGPTHNFPNLVILTMSKLSHLCVSATGKYEIKHSTYNFDVGYHFSNVHNSMNCGQFVFLAAKLITASKNFLQQFSFFLFLLVSLPAAALALILASIRASTLATLWQHCWRRRSSGRGSCRPSRPRLVPSAWRGWSLLWTAPPASLSS